LPDLPLRRAPPSADAQTAAAAGHDLKNSIKPGTEGTAECTGAPGAPAWSEGPMLLPQVRELEALTGLTLMVNGKFKAAVCEL
jgi:hypothetical protein